MSDIEDQVREAQEAGKTTLFLSQLAFTIVDSVLIAHHGENDCIQCLHSSIGLQMVLARFGINSKLWGDAVCVAEVCSSSSYSGWGGFWDKDHHVWLVSEFRELIDLSISKLYRHPSRTQNNVIEMPAIWWQDMSRWPCVIKYLPRGIVQPKLNEEDARDLEKFKKSISHEIDKVLYNGQVEDIIPRPTLYNTDSMNYYYEIGHPWITKVLMFQENKIPQPPWVIRREKEVMAQYNKSTKIQQFDMSGKVEQTS